MNLLRKPEELRKAKTLFANLKKYVKFLIENHFDEVVDENLRRNKEADLPLLKFYAHLPEKEIYNLAAKNLKKFLFMFESENTIEQAIASIDYWKENRLTQILRNDVVPSDISISNNARKQSLIKFLPLYTNDISEAVAIIGELEDFYSFYEFHEIKVFLEIQKDKEKELLKAMEIANIGSYTWDLKKDIIACTPQLYKIFGWAEHESVNFQTFTSSIHPDDIGWVKEGVEYTLKKGSALDMEFKIISRDGQEKIVWSKARVAYEKGQAVRLQGAILDVTKNRLTEMEVRYREAQLSEAQSIAQVGSFDWHFVQNRASCTVELYRIFEWPRDKELNFSTFEALAHPDDLPNVFRSLHTAIEKREIFNCEYRIVTPLQSLKWIWIRGKISFDKNGNAIRLTGTVLDITERKLAEEEIKAKNEAIVTANEKLQIAQKELKQINSQLELRVKERTWDLEQSINEQKKSAEELKFKNEQLIAINSDLDNFIYTASHDLKAPISNIEGLVTLISDYSGDNPEVLNIINMMNSSIARFKNTLLDLTEISKVQKVVRKDIKNVSLASLIDEILDESNDIVQQTKAEVILELQEPSINFSKKNLRSILYNMINNALKYRSPDRSPTIRIKSYKEQGYIVVAVADNGLGLPAHRLDKIFSMFKRFHTHVDGSGIGLYIVKKIMDNTGGKIEVESELGSGSTFYLYFKASPELF